MRGNQVNHKYIYKKGSNNINYIHIGKNTITNSSHTVNEFNRYFTSVAKKIGEKQNETKTSLLQISEELE